MKKTPNWKSLDLKNKCGSCKHYKVFIKEDLLTARGNCTLKNNVYKMRTETCLKYEGVKKMKVYIVFYADAFDDWRLEKVFDAEEKAENYLEGKSSSYSYFEAIVE